MNSAIVTQVVRKCIPELLIGSAVCAATYFLLVEPINAKLSVEQKRLVELEKAVAVVRQNTQAMPTTTAALESARVKLDLVEARSKLAANHADAFMAIMNLADRTSVRVSQLTPTAARARPTAAATAPAAQAGGRSGPDMPGGQGAGLGSGPSAVPGSVQSTGQTRATNGAPQDYRAGYQITGTASLQNAMEFVREVQHGLGYSSIRGVTITPTSDARDAGVSIKLDMELCGVDTKAILASFIQPAASGSGAVMSPGGQISSVEPRP